MGHSRRVLFLALFFLAGGICGSSLAGEDEEPGVVYQLAGDQYGDEFGSALATLDDLDGDGVPEFAASAREDIFSLQDLDRGYVRIISGKSGETIRTLRGFWRNQEFGRSLLTIGDMNGDGFRELVVGSNFAQSYIYSPGNGELLLHFDLKIPGSFVLSPSALGDVDGDGIPDLFYGNPDYNFEDDDLSLLDFGRVLVLSPGRGTILWQRFGHWDKQSLGYAHAGISDFDGDGTADVIVSERSPDLSYGRLRVLSSLTGAVLKTMGDRLRIFELGKTMANLGDLNGDGASEIAVAGDYPEERAGFHGLGIVLILDGRTLEIIRRHEGFYRETFGFHGDLLGSTMSSAGDVDLDGVPDYLLGTDRGGGVLSTVETGMLYLRSGKSGRLLQAYEGRHGDRTFVGPLAPLGDVDGDGVPEFLVGSPSNPDGLPDHRRGEVRVVRYDAELPTFIRGDANNDGVVDMADALTLFNAFVWDRFEGDCLEALDADGDNFLDGQDGARIIGYLFLGRFPPPPPFPECGRFQRFYEGITLSCERSTCDP